MVMKNHPSVLKADALALYGSRPNATIRSAAADLGINPETPQSRVRTVGASRSWGRRTYAGPAVGPLEAANAALRKKSASRRRNMRTRGRRRSISPRNRCRCVADLRAAAA
ncbi:hypothetical protein ACIOGT_24825 [Streptomyces microflavus]|uniref:hypothetical protein n=1 Tax=Streptomyces microflavus TaxID=1919 RepID=UPI00381EB48C